MNGKQANELLENYRKKGKFVKKTLTIPQYLEEKARMEDINFSKLLTEALKIVLDVK
jgi:post-segregation antitoxin (ccd killing protein)